MVWEATYQPFGKTVINTGSVVVNNWRMPGQYHDAETGLHYNNFRYYDPELGRYLTPDPIGLEGGINLYAYSENNPVNGIDPWGLDDALINPGSYLGTAVSSSSNWASFPGYGPQNPYAVAEAALNAANDWARQKMPEEIWSAMPPSDGQYLDIVALLRTEAERQIYEANMRLANEIKIQQRYYEDLARVLNNSGCE